MQSDFETLPRILAFPVTQLASVSLLTDQLGAYLSATPAKPDSPQILCLAGGLDRDGSTELRGLLLGQTATTTPLSDGRHAFSGYWTHSAIQAVTDDIVNAQELTQEQFALLIPSIIDL
jgi:hypothetical protein